MRAVSGKRTSAASAGRTNMDTGSDSSGHSKCTAVCSNTRCLEHSKQLFSVISDQTVSLIVQPIWLNDISADSLNWVHEKLYSHKLEVAFLLSLK